MIRSFTLLARPPGEPLRLCVGCNKGQGMVDEIRFYSVADEYGESSDFALYAVQPDGRKWPASEHCRQAARFSSRPGREAVGKAGIADTGTPYG